MTDNDTKELADALADGPMKVATEVEYFEPDDGYGSYIEVYQGDGASLGKLFTAVESFVDARLDDGEPSNYFTIEVVHPSRYRVVLGSDVTVLD